MACLEEKEVSLHSQIGSASTLFVVRKCSLTYPDGKHVTTDAAMSATKGDR
jgi:hypothetical protein